MSLFGSGSGLRPGDKAPDLTLPDQDGADVRLADLWAGGPLVVYFYPRDYTPACTAQACAFRDSHDAFREAGARVVGVSADGADSHREFAKEMNLPFPLLSDPGGAARKAFGVPGTLGVLPGRVTYVIGPDGTVRHVFSSQFRPEKHVREALDTVRALAGGDS